MPVVSQSIMKPMVPVGASTEACALRKPFVLAELLTRRPTPWWPARGPGASGTCTDRTRRWRPGACASPACGRRRCGRSRRTGRRPRRARRSGVRRTGHQRGDRTRPSRDRRRSRSRDPSPSAARRGWRSRCRAGGSRRVVLPIASVGKSAKQIEMSIAVMMTSTAFANSAGVEGVVVLEELQQVQRRQVAGGVVERHVLRARVGRGDPAGLGVGVPVVDGVVVLQARVGALPRGLADLAEQVAGVDGLDDLAGAAGRAGRSRCRPRPRA